MKILVGLSYLCCVFAILGLTLLAFDEIRWRRFWKDDDSFMLLLLLPPVLQLFYIRRISAVLHLPVFKQTRMLDELSIQDAELDSEVVGTNAFWQGVVVVNSLLLSALVLGFTTALPYVIMEILDGFKNVESVSLMLIFFAYLFAIPTIVFNLRTFGVRRVLNRRDNF
jgi:hypothetical protein